MCESSDPTGYELGVEVEMGALCVQRGSRGVHLCGPGSMCASSSFVLGTWKAGNGGDNCQGSVPVARRPLRASSCARGFMAQSQGVVKTRAHGCPLRKLQPTRPRRSSRKTFEHSGEIGPKVQGTDESLLGEYRGTPGRQPGGGASFVPHGVQADAAPRRQPQVVDATVDELARGQRQGPLVPRGDDPGRTTLPRRHV